MFVLTSEIFIECLQKRRGRADRSPSDTVCGGSVVGREWGGRVGGSRGASSTRPDAGEAGCLRLGGGSRRWSVSPGIVTATVQRSPPGAPAQPWARRAPEWKLRLRPRAIPRPFYRGWQPPGSQVPLSRRCRNDARNPVTHGYSRGFAAAERSCRSATDARFRPRHGTNPECASAY